MPTGYTAALYEGKPQTFEQFALKAARAMGAAIMQRDEAAGPIREEQEESSYYRESLEKENARLAEYHGFSALDWRSAEAAAREEQTQQVNRAIQKAAELRVRYESMLAEVSAWVPPTSEHEGLKDFMIQQLTESIKFDCSTKYLTIPPKRPWDEFKAQRIAETEKSVERARKGWLEEQKRAAERKQWVRDLRDSLSSERAESSAS